MQATPIQLNKGKKVSIYGLLNPISNKIFYIGATYRHPYERFANHIHELKHEGTRKTNEIFDIIMSGNYVGLCILEEKFIDDTFNVSELEQHYIDLNIRNGINLLQDRTSTYPVFSNIKDSTASGSCIVKNIKTCQDNTRSHFKKREEENNLFAKANELGYSDDEIVKMAIKNARTGFTIFNSEKTKSISFPLGFFVKNQTPKFITHASNGLFGFNKRKKNSVITYCSPCSLPFIAKYAKTRKAKSFKFLSFIPSVPVI